MSNGNALIGTWRLARFETWNVDGGIEQPLGPSPAGYAVFDATGHAFIQLARAAAAGVSAEAIAGSFVAYFGSFTLNDDKTEFTVLVEASNLADYVASHQVRPFQISGNTLVLGIPGLYRATLHRVAA
jgi:hypothetical protein